MSLTIGITAAFGAVAGFTVSGAAKFLDGFSVFGSPSNKLPSWGATLLIGSLIGGGLGYGASWYADDSVAMADLGNIDRAQAMEIVACHDNAPEGFDVTAGISDNGKIICNYIKPN